MNILISFCNTIETSDFYQKNKLSQLAIVNTKKSKIYFLKMPIQIKNNGVTGLSRNDKYLYVVTQSWQYPYLIKYDLRNFNILSFKKIKHVKDPHAMAIRDKTLFICSSGTNSIEKYDSKTFRYLGREWQHPNTTKDSDQVHLNSIFFKDGSLYASCFGEKRGKYWSTANKGYIINTNNYKKEYKISHPHSAKYDNSKIYYCESTRGRIYQQGNLLIDLNESYVRGLALFKSKIIFGISSGRRKSRSTQDLHNAFGFGKFIAKSGLCILDSKTKEKTYYSLINFGREVFDVLIIPKFDTINVNKVLDISKSETLVDSPLVSIFYEKKIKRDILIRNMENRIAKSEEKYRVLENKYNDIVNSSFYKFWNLYLKIKSSIMKTIQR